MDHPTLNSVERLVVAGERRKLEQLLLELPEPRRAFVALAVVAELADLVLETYNRAVPPPPASLCGIKQKHAGHVLHCKLAVNHPGPCCHD